VKIAKRTFEASKYEKGSVERSKLNESPVTSEYMRSYKYVLLDDKGQTTSFAYRTKQEAINAAQNGEKQ
jgi:hypothetical protein